jgi:NAD+ synthase (glutamine-hydrolysing)
MPVRRKGFLYNCMVSVVNGAVVFIYPKSVLCNDDIYRESRWFVPWQRKNEVVDFELPVGYGFKQVSPGSGEIQSSINSGDTLQRMTKFGSGFMESGDQVKIGFEMCEEMWTAKS